MSTTSKVGTIGWIDLTVPHAESVKNFYKEVVGWETTSIDMGGYQDYCMTAPGASQPAAGICHARGVNADLPPVWLIYITVSNLDLSMAHCIKAGGTVVGEPRTLGGYGRMCIIKDPAGVISALFESVETAATL